MDETTAEFAIKTVIRGDHVECEVDTRTQKDRGFIETSIFFADEDMVVFSDSVEPESALCDHRRAVRAARLAVSRFDEIANEEYSRLLNTLCKVTTCAMVGIEADKREWHEKPF